MIVYKNTYRVIALCQKYGIPVKGQLDKTDLKTIVRCHRFKPDPVIGLGAEKSDLHRISLPFHMSPAERCPPFFLQHFYVLSRTILLSVLKRPEIYPIRSITKFFTVSPISWKKSRKVFFASVTTASFAGSTIFSRIASFALSMIWLPYFS